MPEEGIGEGSKPGGKEEKMIVILFSLRPAARYAKEESSRDEFKDKAAKALYIECLVNGSSKNQLGRSKAERCDRLYWRVCKEIRC